MYKYYCIFSKSKRSDNYKYLFESIIPKDWIKDNDNYEYLFIFGGDGTFLKSKCYFYKKKCKVIMINAGNFGFFSYFDENNLNFIFSEILNRNNFIQMSGLKVKFLNNEYIALNDLFISSFLRLSLLVKINGEEFEYFKGTGLLFSSTFGSSAYNKSAGGAIFLNPSNHYQMVEICPANYINFNTIKSPLIFNSADVIELIIDEQMNDCYGLIDGEKIELKNINRIKIYLDDCDFELFNPTEKRILKLKNSYITRSDNEQK
ncbi:MAG: NAD(+)/NADH kinase [Mycoplasmoidaceae bacterium]